MIEPIFPGIIVRGVPPISDEPSKQLRTPCTVLSLFSLHDKRDAFGTLLQVSGVVRVSCARSPSHRVLIFHGVPHRRTS